MPAHFKYTHQSIVYGVDVCPNQDIGRSVLAAILLHLFIIQFWIKGCVRVRETTSLTGLLCERLAAVSVFHSADHRAYTVATTTTKIAIKSGYIS